MLNLTLRKEFLKRNIPGTTIAFHQGNSQGAIDKSPEEFLKITYPTVDVIKALNRIREMEYEGINPEETSYSIQPLTVYMMQLGLEK